MMTVTKLYYKINAVFFILNNIARVAITLM